MNIARYNTIRDIDTELLNINNIITYVPNPIDSDYQRGWITRYFVQKTNDINSPIYEIDVSNTVKYGKNPYLNLVSIKWRISGPPNSKYDESGRLLDKGVIESNISSIQTVIQIIPNLKRYLPNLLQFYRP